MSLLRILYYPDERLRKIAKPFFGSHSLMSQIVANMFDTMYAQDGIGLAATQVNIHQRIIVIDISTKHDRPLVLINPEIITKTGIIRIHEGCLSIPHYRSYVPRFKKIKFRALNLQGYYFEVEAEDLLAVCIQHEMDHLIGKLFIDYLSPFKKQRILQKIKKIKTS